MTIPPPHAVLPEIDLSDDARVLLGQITDKWSIVIMSKLCQGPVRFNALKRAVSGITQKALTQSLRRLERNGLVERRILPGSPPAVEYRGTDLGFSLAPPMRSLYAWAAERLPDVESAQARYDRDAQDL
jgi:DNA-binding HxlR family transcriptional regulator